MGNTVGTNGLAAIRDFVKPYIISASDISNSSEIEGKWDTAIGLSMIPFGHVEQHYTWSIDSAKISEALKWNFWEVTEFSSQSIVILHKVNNDTYEGQRRENSYIRYRYVITVYSNYCDVWVYGENLVYYDDGTAEPFFDLTNLFTFTQEEMIAVFGQLMSGASFVFTKTDSDTSGIDFGSNADRWYLRSPLDLQGQSFGYIVCNHYASLVATDSGGGLSSFNMKWIGNSHFFNRHQIWLFSIELNSKTLTLINTQDLAIQSLSASDYANLSTKDPNTLYFVPEE